jgi:protein-S-isoprenylcysteine O-methyltransferase Ste14
LPEVVRFGGLCLLFGSLALYTSALIALGKANTYCEPNRLVTRGIYRWTRNPQYATIIPLYIGLAIAADSAQTTVLCAGLVAVYILMAVVEEPWLELAYGESYRRYRACVPRFFNWRRVWVLGQWVLRTILSKPLLRQEEAARSIRSDQSRR